MKVDRRDLMGLSPFSFWLSIDLVALSVRILVQFSSVSVSEKWTNRRIELCHVELCGLLTYFQMSHSCKHIDVRTN